MNRVKFKMKSLLALLMAINCGLHVSSLPRSSLSFEMCSPYDSTFQLNYILIDSCTTVPCVIPIGQEVVITGSFTYTGVDMETDVKLKHRPNWLLNYVYTAATVVQNDNKFSASDRFNFEATIFVDQSLAPLKGTLNWRLYDEDENRIACYNIPIQLTL